MSTSESTQQQTQQQTQQPTQLQLLDVKQLEETLRLLVISLNKSCKNGSFTLDESYLLRLSLNNTEKSLLTLDTLQQYFQEKEKKADKTVLDELSSKVELLDVSKLNNTLNLINTSLNKACKDGTFTLDESYLLKVAMSNMEKLMQTLDTLQKLFQENNKQ